MHGQSSECAGTEKTNTGGQARGRKTVPREKAARSGKTRAATTSAQMRPEVRRVSCGRRLGAADQTSPSREAHWQCLPTSRILRGKAPAPRYRANVNGPTGAADAIDPLSVLRRNARKHGRGRTTEINKTELKRGQPDCASGWQTDGCKSVSASTLRECCAADAIDPISLLRLNATKHGHERLTKTKQDSSAGQPCD